jgi:hypothetical protein
MSEQIQTENKPVGEMSNITAIKTFFSEEKPVTMQELRKLTRKDREELGELARIELKNDI